MDVCLTMNAFTLILKKSTYYRNTVLQKNVRIKCIVSEHLIAFYLQLDENILCN